MNFLQYLTESLDIEKLKHLEHLEDHIIHGGHEGVQHAHETLSDVLSFLEGKQRKNFNLQTKVTTKYDGAPSIVFGIDPQTKRFFVATKSAFNKDPKIAFSNSDIEQMYGHAPGLVLKLKAALKELPKIMPKQGGVFQSDLMYEKTDLQDNNKAYSFTPNTITYSTDKDSAMGRSIAASQIGIVVHSRYTGGKTLQDMKVSFDVDQSAFGKDPDVHMINPEVSGGDIAPIEKKQYESEIQQAIDLYKGMPDDIFNVVDGHDATIKTYINTCVRDGTVPSAKGYLAYVKERNKKDIEKLKSEKGKAAKKEKAANIESHIKNHIESFDSVFKMHGYLQRAKNSLVNALSRIDTGFKTTIGGKPTKPEGFVAIRGGRPTKLVDRADFSAANFAVGAFRKGSKEEQAAAVDLKPVVTSFGRMNPPTYAGHGAVVGKVSEVAKEMKAPSVIALSRSQDPEKNPLTPEQKLKHAKRMFPDANIMLADQDIPTVIQHLKKLNQKGHNHLVLVVGSDRVEAMKKMLENTNGRDFAFDKIDVVSSGERDADVDEEQDEDKNQTEEEKRRKMSATKMRGHAIRGKFSDFKAGMHPKVSEEHAREMYQEVRQGMDIKIGSETSSISLARYAKRKDPIGVKARREIQRREVAKEMDAKQKQSKKPAKKTIKEESLTGGVAGLGLVSGNPAIDDEQSGNYVAQNTADSDQRDNILHLWLKSAQLHDRRLKFSEFNPKERKSR